MVGEVYPKPIRPIDCHVRPCDMLCVYRREQSEKQTQTEHGAVAYERNLFWQWHQCRYV